MDGKESDEKEENEVKWKNATKTISEKFWCQNREKESISKCSRRQGSKVNNGTLQYYHKRTVRLLGKWYSFFFVFAVSALSFKSEVSFQLKLYYIAEIHIWRVGDFYDLIRCARLTKCSLIHQKRTTELYYGRHIYTFSGTFRMGDEL